MAGPTAFKFVGGFQLAGSPVLHLQPHEDEEVTAAGNVQQSGAPAQKHECLCSSEGNGVFGDRSESSVACGCVRKALAPHFKVGFER